MTNDQQAYDRAMAHNALLREALHDLYSEHPSTTWSEDQYVLKALNATEADAEAWLAEKTNDAYSRGAQHAYNAHAELRKEYEQQLATVTNERDALREYADHKFSCWHNHEPVEGTKFGTCTCGFEALAQKADT